jgi:hypothetical protein
MKKVLLIIAMVAMAVSLSFAQLPGPDQTTDVLGAHKVYGRGCEGCHVPHSGAFGNGGSSADTSTGKIALWGQDMQPLYGQTLYFGDGNNYPVTLPNTSDNAVTLSDGTVVNPVANPDHKTPFWSTMACLSCHDGNMATSTAMKGTTVETLQINGHVFNPPTLLGNDGSAAGNYHNDHPIGLQATVGCGTWDWDCTYSAGTYTLGPNEKIFAANYMDPTQGILKSTVNGGSANGNYVVCTTCHDQHSMTAYKAFIGDGNGGGTYQYVKTSFFLRGYYDNSTGGNNTAQFCRQCHGGEANEMHGVYSVPTT